MFLGIFDFVVLVEDRTGDLLGEMSKLVVLCCPSPPVDTTTRCCFSPLRCLSSPRLTRLSFKCRAELRAPYTSSSVSSNKVKISGSFLVAACMVIQNSSSEAFAAVENTSTQCIGFAGDNTPVLIVVACVVQAVALVGAAVGGILARQRKQEVEKINGQLRQIFAKMRRQYQVENYAPALTYAPAVTIAKSQPEMAVESDKEELMKHLRAGKKFLRERNPQQALDEFQEALRLAKQLDDKVEQKKAARGLGACCQRQGKFRDAIKYHSMVLTISHISGEHSGVTEALGAIADCYAELDDLENAAKYYDQYIARIDEE